MPKQISVHVLQDHRGNIIGCFSSYLKAKTAQDQWHLENFVKPFIVKCPVE
jgi:hypothetical protein